jgi:hypothetical protein
MFQVSGFMLLVPCCLLLVACRLYSGTKLVEVHVSKFWELVLGSWFLGLTADCGLQAVDHAFGRQAVDCRLWTKPRAGRLPTADYGLRTVD